MSEEKKLKISWGDLRKNAEVSHSTDDGKKIITVITSHPGFPAYLYRIQITVNPEMIDFYTQGNKEDDEHVHIRVHRRNAEDYPRGEKEDVWPREIFKTYCHYDEAWREGFNIISKNLVLVWEELERKRDRAHKRRMRQMRAANIANDLYLQMRYQGIEEMPKGDKDGDNER